ncbi:1-acyl-sn-glycerol-3-phosphate acyltransferase [Cellulosimicrobium arenosum]|uniref:1-acyl-sn-glycerol-3-phosphate acyltransferase n=1 Tax=Cellulosimicrobium arenosum TaxID=2708133 RepID=A0A927G885_9MICO|nr:1-acyl-sn-glycerol-3-phosphate acyltransferase [Cellulosimicrobium arenosum]MBD8078282.1 1-acyl-sn-glycerol-3-phosphate acyltransferase [Cellulosimicrobium arenosum]
MNVAPPPRWVRRLVVAPLVVLLAVALLPTSFLFVVFVAAVVSWALPGRLRVVRAVWIACFYVLWDAAAVVALFALWVASGFGWAVRRAPFRRAHVRLAGAMLSVLFWQVRWTLRLRIEVDLSDAAGLDDEPVLVVSRHAGPGDSFIIMDRILNRFRREPRVVLKDTLQWDPAIDALLHRIPAYFVVPRSRRRAGAASGTDAVAHLAARMAPDAALLLFPEGGNVTPRRRDARIAALRAVGEDHLADRAEQMPHVMAPHVGGFLAALDGTPTTGVAVVAHTGLEDLVTPRDIWRELPMDKKITMKVWSTPRVDLPAGDDERAAWLYAQWARLDAWLATEGAPTARSADRTAHDDGARPGEGRAPSGG